MNTRMANFSKRCEGIVNRDHLCFVTQHNCINYLRDIVTVQVSTCFLRQLTLSRKDNINPLPNSAQDLKIDCIDHKAKFGFKVGELL